MTRKKQSEEQRKEQRKIANRVAARKSNKNKREIRREGKEILGPAHPSIAKIDERVQEEKSKVSNNRQLTKAQKITQKAKIDREKDKELYKLYEMAYNGQLSPVPKGASSASSSQLRTPSEVITGKFGDAYYQNNILPQFVSPKGLKLG